MNEEKVFDEFRAANDEVRAGINKNPAPDEDWDQYKRWPPQRLVKFIWGLIKILKNKF